MFVACYILIVRLTGLQEFHFVPSYAACMNVHLRKFGKIVHYFLVVGLFLLFPLIVTIFSYKKVSKYIEEHNKGVVQALRSHRDDMATVSTNEIRISKSLFVIVFAFMLCWIPTWFFAIFAQFHAIASYPVIMYFPCQFVQEMNPLVRREFRRLHLCKAGERVEDHAGLTRRPNKLSWRHNKATI